MRTINNNRKTEWIECRKSSLLNHINYIISETSLASSNEQLQIENIQLQQTLNNLEQQYTTDRTSWATANRELQQKNDKLMKMIDSLEHKYNESLKSIERYKTINLELS
jgi:hypothetical protein